MHVNFLDLINKSCQSIILENNRKEKYLNEKSIQMKIAFDIWKNSGIEPELEKCFNYDEINKKYTDIYFEGKSRIGIEIKFKTKKIGSLKYVNQGAQTNGKLNSVKDIYRLLSLKNKNEINSGFFVFITNDYLYWKKCKIGKTNSHEYSFENLISLKKFFNAPNWYSRTYEKSIDLSNIKYGKINWVGDDFGKEKNSFRYFIIEV